MEQGGGSVVQCWWNSGRVMVAQCRWNSDSGTVWWNSKTVFGTVWWSSRTVEVQQCCRTVLVEEWNSGTVKVEHCGGTVEQ